MEFKRKKKRGQRGRVRRTFVTEDGYRIVWRKEVCGVHVLPRFQATVRMLIPYSGKEPQQIWDFVNRARPLIKTMKAAQEECIKHKRLWEKACVASGVRELKELFGKIPSGLPLWATKKANRKVYGLCLDNRPAKYREDDDECSDPSDQPETSATSPSCSTGLDGPKDGLASPVKDEVTPFTPMSAAPIKNAAPVTEPAKVPRLRSCKSIAKPSKSTRKKKSNTTPSSGSARKRSSSSRKPRSKPSRS